MVEKIDPSDPEARRISWQDRLPEEVVVEPEIDHSSVNVINQRIKSRCWEELTGSCGLCIDPSAGEVSQKLVEACRIL